MPYALSIALLIGLFPFINWCSSLLIGILIGTEDHCLRTLGSIDNQIICVNSLQAIMYSAASFVLGLLIVPLLCFVYKAKLRQWQIRMWLAITVVILPFLVMAIFVAVKDSMSDAIQLIAPTSIAIALTSLILPRLIGRQLTSSSELADCIQPEKNADKIGKLVTIFFSVLIVFGFLSAFIFSAERYEPEFFAIDTCLDSGGRWNYDNKECER